jgi:TctA family transporter
MHLFISSALIAIATFIYFTPTMIAHRRMKQVAARLFLLNLLLGWTFMGWFGALSWATSSAETDSRSAANAARKREYLRQARNRPREWY